MTAEETTAYLSGTLGMYAIIHKERASCVFKWYAPKDASLYIMRAFERYKDKPAEAILYAILNKKCEEKPE